jgi:Ser/Thr protein kinase RdoA (MazF antagonist)
MEQVQQVLSRYPADHRIGRIEPLGSAGGMSGAEFWRVNSPLGRLILRRWPNEHPMPDGLQFIHSVLRHVFDRGLKIVPVPLATVDDATFVEQGGHLWQLELWMPGVADYERSPSVERLRAAMSVLARFHVAAADYSSLASNAPWHAPSPAIANRLGRLRDLQTGGIDALAGAVMNDVWPELAQLAKEFLATLPGQVPNAIAVLAPLAGIAFPLQPSIRDIWHDHVLFEGEVVSGLIDFGAMQIETPAGDIARLMSSLVGDDATGWREGLAAYAAIRPLSDRELSAIGALDVSGNLLAGCNWIRWIYVEGRQFENRMQVLERFRRIVARLRR